jgi:hypothetical protein
LRRVSAMQISTVIWSSVLSAAALAACAPIDGYTVACDVHETTHDGTVHAWCAEDYGVPEDLAPYLRADCQLGSGNEVGMVVDACPTAGVSATCTESLPSPDGRLTALRMYFYADTIPDGGPTTLAGCPAWYQP